MVLDGTREFVFPGDFDPSGWPELEGKRLPRRRLAMFAESLLNWLSANRFSNDFGQVRADLRWIFPFFSFFGKSGNYLYDLSIFGFNEFYTMFEILVGIANFMKELVDWSNFFSLVDQIVIFEECEINIELNFSKELLFYFRLVDAAVWNSFRGIEN